jgi:hypothetical protein
MTQVKATLSPRPHILMINDILIVGLIFADFALIIFAVYLLFLKSNPVYEFGYIARFMIGIISMIMSVIIALHFNNGDIGVYGLPKPLQDSGLYWFFLIVTGIMFLYSVPLTVIMYIIERTGWLVAPVDQEIRKARRSLQTDEPYYSREEILGEGGEERLL